MPHHDLLVVGELNVDLILNEIEGFPKIGTEILADQMNLVMGSSSAIMAANSASIGVKTSFCGLVGDDNFGKLILDELSKKQVSTKYIQTSPDHKTGITIVMNYEEDRANVTYCGAMEALNENHIPWNELGDFKHFHLSNFFIQKGIRNDITNIFKKAKTQGVTTSLDLQWDPENKWDFNYKECLPHVDVFMPNESELLALTKASSIEEGVKLISPYANTIVIKMGSKGSMAYQNGEKTTVKAFKNPEYVDAIGAGDSFNSGFIQKYIERKSIEKCLKHGNLMGALNTTAAGGTAAFTDRDNINGKVKSIFNSAL
ncbi:carbohydrate kinase family protein [Galbibacter sp. EGI 63066]|uniref:carbohydrate kinase family protein n=1 Tax=Galbibacter sp. EGI 63066 TaxID=2993559 RepID=UPI0022491F2C|nr:carbohydrate kinase family protein [Galbibacter sp. EGI 63066]MCX2679241.1 carbohydrate kinase family protein [Galbibacter sp. EGI 63066]